MTSTRLAAEADAAAIARIYNEGIAERIATFETEPRKADEVARVLKERAARWPTVVVERDGAVTAWAAASEYRPRACYAGVAEFSVYVSRADREAGAGRAAMEALIAACEQRGIHSSSRGCSLRTKGAGNCSRASASARWERTGARQARWRVARDRHRRTPRRRGGAPDIGPATRPHH